VAKGIGRGRSLLVQSCGSRGMFPTRDSPTVELCPEPVKCKLESLTCYIAH